MYIEILEKHGVKQSKEFTLDVLASEVGKLFTIRIYTHRFGKSGYQGDEKLELSDALTQIGLQIEQAGYDIEELRKMGLERFDDRIAEVKREELRRKFGD